jgi:ParB-like chromosome segregation protein Spo0J
MAETHAEMQTVAITALGERLSALRLCESAALEMVRRSLDQHGQLSALTVFAPGGDIEVIDGFKRVRAARALGWRSLLVRVDDVSSVDAKLRLRELHGQCRLTELEEAWLVRSLYREDRLSQPEIARRMNRHKSWVCRRLMLVEALDVVVQADVRLGLLAPRAAVAVSRLPHGNQPAASAVVMRRGLTVQQSELLIDEVLALPDPRLRAALLARRLDDAGPVMAPGRRATRAVRSDADWMSQDIARLHQVAARLQARLGSTPLEVFTPAAAELVHDALVRLSAVLRALDVTIAAVTGPQEVA